MARPKSKIDIEALKTAVAIQCSWEEIESLVGVSRRTLVRDYAQVIEDARNKGKMSLRRKQFEVAMTGNVPMLIWLGKQYLAQTDKNSLELTDETLVQAAEERLKAGAPENSK